MAKKKPTSQQENPTKKQEHTGINRAMEDDAALENLKSLNVMLVKQTSELRQQVSSLKKSNESLESELIRSNSEKETMSSEIGHYDERMIELEVERIVASSFALELRGVIESERDEFKRGKVDTEGKLEGLEREMQHILRERDEKESAARSQIETQMLELNAMSERLIDVEKREKLLSSKFEELKAEYASAMVEKEEMGRKIDSAMRDRDSLQKNLIEYNNEIQEIKMEIVRICKEKEEVKQERDAGVMKRSELENIVCGLNVTVSSLQNEEEKLLVYVTDLENKCSEGAEKEREMQRHLDELVKEKNELEMSFQRLIDEKELVNNDLDGALKKLDEYQRKLEGMADENSMISVDNAYKESEINELQKQIVGLRNVVSGFEKSCSDQQDKIKNLVSELDSCKADFERVKLEKNEAIEELDEEKQNCVSLKQKIMEMEKNIEVNVKLIEEMKEEIVNMTNKKEELESHRDLLKKEIASRVKELADARTESYAFKGKAELGEAKSQLVLNALRSTAEIVNSKDDNNVPVGIHMDDEQMKGEIEPYMVELEGIKSAFRIKKNKVEDMKRQLEFLENSVAAAQKNKSLLTFVSSATSLFAAISLAYLARRH